MDKTHWIDRKYHDAQEELDDALMKDFTENSTLFEEVSRQARYKIDYLGKDKRGRYLSIEFKRRQCDHNKYHTTFIECNKAWQLMEDWAKYERIPLYLNWYDDCVVIFDLRQHLDNMKEFFRPTITNHGYNEKTERPFRYGLPIDKSIKFIKINSKWLMIDDGKEGKTQ